MISTTNITDLKVNTSKCTNKLDDNVNLSQLKRPSLREKDSYNLKCA